MTDRSLRRLFIGAIATPLALGLAACGGSADDAAVPSGEPIEKIAPPEGTTWSEVIEETDDGGYRMGNPEAPIKLVEFGSLTCPHCATFAQESDEELRETFVDSGRVSFEFHNFVRDPIDITAAQLTRCGAPESYFALTDQVMANQAEIIEKVQNAGQEEFAAAVNMPEDKRSIAIAELAGLIDFFGARGIAREQAETCLADSGAAQALAQATESKSKALDISGTPTFLINGSKIDLNTWPKIKERLEELGAR